MKDLNKDKEILSYIAPNGKRIAARCKKDVIIKRGWYDYLMQRYDDNTSIRTPELFLREILHRLENGIEIVPKCRVCGKPLIFADKRYPTFCSKKCANSDPEILEKNKLHTSEAMKKYHEQKRMKNDSK